MKFDLRIIACKLADRITEIHIPNSGRTLLSARLLMPDAGQYEKKRRLYRQRRGH